MQESTATDWRRPTWFGALVVALLAWVSLYRDPLAASDFEIVPDSTEFAVGAANLASGAGYHIVVDGRRRPPRYMPWFSALVLTPAFWVSDDLGSSIVPITVLGVLAVVTAYWIAARLGGPPGGYAAALAVVALPLFIEWGRQVMTDVPSLALQLVSMLLFVKAWRADQGRLRFFIAGGVVIAVNFALRPVSAAAALPWMAAALMRGSLKPRLAAAAAIVLPTLAVQQANWSYNAATFGSSVRSGFHYWCGVPYDYPELYFSPSGMIDRLRFLVDTRFFWLLVVTLGLAALAVKAGRHRNRPLLDLPAVAVYTALAIPPMLLFHLAYYQPRPRYFMPAIVLLLVCAGGFAGKLVPRLNSFVPTGLMLLVIAFTATWRGTSDPETPRGRLAVEDVREKTPDDAWIITGLPVSYVEHVGNPSHGRTIMPYSRRDEYASKLITAARVARPEPPPAHPQDHRCAGLLAGGAVEAVRTVAVECLDDLEERLRAGRTVFIETSRLSPPDSGELWKPLTDRFSLERRGADLWELRAKP